MILRVHAPELPVAKLPLLSPAAPLLALLDRRGLEDTNLPNFGIFPLRGENDRCGAANHARQRRSGL